jgi:glycosyltransferase involved in cell wall biosynthesis
MPVRAYRRDYLEEAIGSILRQTCGQWRLLIIVGPDDGDGFRSAWRHRLDDPRIDLVVNEGRKLAGKFNTGMRHARTEFVSALFADDLWAEDAIAVIRRHIHQHPDADLFHSSRRFIDDAGRSVSGVHPSRPGVSRNDFLDDSPIKHLLCWRVEKALSFGGMDESLNSIGVDDFDFPWTMADHGARFVSVPECLYIVRDHRACFRLTTHVPRSTQVRELRRIMRKHGASRAAVRRRVAGAQRSHLRQCLYANRVDRWLKQRWGANSNESWREPLV